MSESKDLTSETKNQTLMELVMEAAAIEEALIHSGGEITPEIEAMLYKNEKELVQKVDSYVMVMERLNMAQAYYKEKADIFNQHAKSASKAVDFLKSRVKQGMETLKVTELVGGDYKFKLTNNSQSSLTVLDESKVPEAFWNVVQTKVIDNKRLKEAVEGGANIEGVSVVRGTHVRASVKARGK